MPSPIPFVRSPFRRAAWASRDAGADAAQRLQRAFALAAAASARPGAPNAARRSVAALEAEVRACAARWKAAGIPPEQVLVRVSDATRRHALDFPDPEHAAGLRHAVFCAFLRGYYGEARVRCRPVVARAPRDASAHVLRLHPSRDR
jgi:hypothetical protein